MQQSTHLLSWSLLLSALAVLLLTFKLGQRYLALRHIPGPRLAAWTDLWLLKQRWSGRNELELLSTLGQTYGPLVRYGPKRVLFSDPKLVTTIYGTAKPYDKGPFYEVPRVKVNGRILASFATIRDEKLVTAIKRQIAFAFSTTAMNDLEHHVDLTIDTLITKLGKKSGTVDLLPFFGFFAFDSVCRLAFSDALSKQSDCEAVLAGGKARFSYWRNWSAVPALEKLLFKNRFIKGSAVPNALGALAQQRVADRIEKGGVGVHHDLLDRLFQAQKADPHTFNSTMLTGFSLSMIHAGADTTAHTLANLFWELLKNPEVYQKLKDEIRAANFSSPPRIAEVRKHPLLEACIKETGRMHTIFSEPLERMVPEGGLQVDDVWIPGGTVIAANHQALARDPSIYTDPNQFKPHRWLNASPSQLSAMERSNFFFSQGKRNCIGQNIAWMEMLKVVPALLNAYDIELADPLAERQEETIIMTYTLNLPVKLSPRKAT